MEEISLEIQSYDRHQMPRLHLFTFVMITSQNNNKHVNLVLLFIVIEVLQLIYFPNSSL